MPATFIPMPPPAPVLAQVPWTIFRSTAIASGHRETVSKSDKDRRSPPLALYHTPHTVLKALHHSESILIPTPQQPQFTCDSYLTNGITAAYNGKELVHRHTQLVVAELGSTPQVGSSPLTLNRRKRGRESGD